MQSGVVGVLLG